MKQKHRNKPASERNIALQRIKTLLDRARDVFGKDRGLANRYVTLARKISMKLKVRIPREYKRRFCKHCYKFLMPGVNCRVRSQKGKIVYYCSECKHFMRFPYIKEQKDKRKEKLKCQNFPSSL